MIQGMTDKELAECRLDEIGTQKDIGLYWKARCEAAEICIARLKVHCPKTRLVFYKEALDTWQKLIPKVQA